MKPLPTLDDAERWRLLLGEAGAASLGPGGAGAPMDRALAWLYGRDDPQPGDGPEARDTLDRHGGSEASQLSVPEWINQIHELFPKETIERLERDAIERYGIDEVVTNLEVLERATPNPALLQAVLRTKHLMNPQVLAMARQLVAKVVRELIEKLAKEVRRAFNGRRQPQRLSLTGAAAQFAARETLRRNLRHYDVQRGRLVIERPLFHVNTQRVLEPWQVLLLVDQSGSMLGSVIHAAVTAACLWGLPGIKTHLIAFDTEVVDLTDNVTDPVEVLMGVQLGGGTFIGKAVGYAAERIEVPRRAIMVVISDFFEGMAEHVLVDHVRALVGQGTQVLGLAALDERADPIYDRALAARLVEAGAHVGAMTPGQLAAWLAEKLK
ncbi:VWA domain-containing protein [Aquincola sp. S2]|uniref:VWA domain-containing protein n=1 Tax=Pseudaquabacterium terrae TaxID=2732868 RepID=A0ABX2EUG3_9BURK|nr:VWA domain-containing protein [Aquabacterium terrae]NRF72233.1 VWA domain-containing protein [Aquabacterium terrae]